MRRRIIWLILSITCAFAVLAGRLFCLTMIAHRDHTDMEHFRLTLTDDGRGRILFRSGSPWSGRMVNSSSGWKHLEQGGGQIPNAVVGQVGLPDVWPTASRVIAEQGRSGLEARFDHVLLGHRPGYVGILQTRDHEQVYGKPMFRSTAVAGSDVRTSIDFAWQNAAEQALRTAYVKQGALVVLDISTNEILAMASISPNPYVNEAVRSVAPGSIFKLVTAAAALETHQFRSVARFFCPGGLHIPGVNMNCWSRHGPESLTDALIQSCDTALAEIGISLGRAPLTAMANHLLLNGTGLQQVDGKSVLPEVTRGQVFRREGADAGLLANTAIGQEDVRISAVQGAILASTIAGGGWIRPARLVLDVEHSHVPERKYGNVRWHRAFSERTAETLADAMRRVVIDKKGTAHDLYPLSLAVKTGTAELPHGEVNAWMIGFAPSHHPKIAFATVVMNEPSKTSHRQVREIVRDIAKAYTQFQPKDVIR